MFKHINDCRDALYKCKNIDEVNELLDNFPRWSGEWWVDTIGEGEDAYYEVINEWYDEQYEEICSKIYELDIEVEGKYIEIEFFEGDEGDLDAEEYVNEEGLEPDSYEIEWDDYRKGYSLRILKED